MPLPRGTSAVSGSGGMAVGGVWVVGGGGGAVDTLEPVIRPATAGSKKGRQDRPIFWHSGSALMTQQTSR